MSHYFQQLFVSSGLARPAVPSATFGPGSFSNTPTLEEISEERIAPPAVSSSHLNPPQPSLRSIPPSAPAARKTLETNYSVTPKAEATDPGVIEIVQTRVDETQLTAPKASDVVSAALSEPASPTSASLPTPERSAPTTKNSAPPSTPAQPEKSSPAPGRPSRDELIQHVFRWVGENPQSIVPPALSNTPGTTEPLKSSKPAAVSTRTAQSAPDSAPVQLIQTDAPTPPPSPAPARTRPQPPSPASETHETSVEISIGTLQIQVEAPPASSTKTAHRPAAPRTPARRPVAAAQPPAIDINRLRRGFYL